MFVFSVSLLILLSLKRVRSSVSCGRVYIGGSRTLKKNGSSSVGTKLSQLAWESDAASESTSSASDYSSSISSIIFNSLGLK